MPIRFLESSIQSKRHIIKNIMFSTKIPVDGNALLSSTQNKLQLVRYFYIKAPKYAQIKDNREDLTI